MLDILGFWAYNVYRKKKKGHKKMTTIYFDMDGTIADLYGVSGWLEMLLAHDPAPYALAGACAEWAEAARL